MFQFSFDFRNPPQSDYSNDLIDEGYKLAAFKGADASGGEQIEAGIPAWFVRGYNRLTGLATINYDPQYSVYYMDTQQVTPDTIITAQNVSRAVSLGNKFTLLQNGQFRLDGPAEPGTIVLQNELDTPGNIVVGLAAETNLRGETLPFCAFFLRPGNQISMTPQENVLLFNTRTDMRSGSVTADVRSPGCWFNFDAQRNDFQLEIISPSMGITNVPGTEAVNIVEAGRIADYINQ